MSDIFGSDFISILDKDGNEFNLEHIMTIDYNNEMYMAFLPADMDEDDDDYGTILLKVVENKGEVEFASIDDEDDDLFYDDEAKFLEESLNSQYFDNPYANDDFNWFDDEDELPF